METPRCNKKALLFLVPGLALHCVFFTYPFSEAAAYSLTDWDGFTAPAWAGIESLKRILTDQAFRGTVIRTFTWAVLSILSKVEMALVITYVLAKATRGIGFFRPVVFLPYIISTSVICLMFTIMCDKDIGLINMLLKAVGSGKYTKHWLSDPKTAPYAVISIPTYQAIEYFLVILFAVMKGIPSDLCEVGKTDGTNSLTEFFLTTLPIVWPTLAVCIVLTVDGALQDFNYIFIMTYSGPGHISEVPATYMYKSIFVNGEYGYGSAAVLILLVLTMMVTSYVGEGLNSRFTTD